MRGREKASAGADLSRPDNVEAKLRGAGPSARAEADCAMRAAREQPDASRAPSAAAPREAAAASSLDQHATPTRRVDVGDGLRESPAVASEILRRVLPLAVHMVGGRRDDLGSCLLGAAVVRVHVGDPHEDRAPRRAGRRSVGSDEVPATEHELGAVLANAKPLDTPESGAELRDRRTHVRVHEHRHDYALRHRAVLRRGGSVIGGSGGCGSSAPLRTNAPANLRANQRKCERSYLLQIAGQVHRS